jgi:hypothetical protein
MARVFILLGMLTGVALGGDEICEPDVEPLDRRPIRLEKRTADIAGDPRADAHAISRATDADSFAATCEEVLYRRYAARASCAADEECGGLDVGMCDGASNRCNCNPGRSGARCEIDVPTLCALENFWTALGGEGLRCAGSLTRTACSPSHDTCAPSQTCSITERTCVCAPSECWDAEAGACVPNELEVRARAWNRAPPGEKADSDLMRRTADFGIALSGGGTRAMVSAFGVLRGLHHAGLLSRARYLGANSGGGWAASIYTYADRAIPDEALLGAYVPPRELANESLYTLDESQGAAAARRPFGAILLTMANNQRLRLRELWSLCVAKVFFEPYGFGKLYSFFGYTPRSVAAIRSASPALAHAPFDTVRPGRPFLLLSATLLGPRAQTVGDGGIKWRDQTAQNFVISPLYVAPVRALADAPPPDGAPCAGGAGCDGSASAGLIPPGYGNANVSFLCNANKNSACAGAGTHAERAGGAGRSVVEIGGVWETHAFGAVSVERGLRRPDGGTDESADLRVRLSAVPFSIAAASGISSSAAAAAVSAQPYGLPGKYCRLAYMAPAAPYASPLPEQPRATLMSWADGAVLDNFGILGMLARGVGSVLLVASAETPLDPGM